MYDPCLVAGAGLGQRQQQSGQQQQRRAGPKGPQGFLGVASARGSAATIVATLPSHASGDANLGRTVTVMKADAGAGTVRITPDGSETINGTASYVALSSQFDYRVLVYDGSSGWVVIGSN